MKTVRSQLPYFLSFAMTAAACAPVGDAAAPPTDPAAAPDAAPALEDTIGPAGGVLEGAPGSAFEGVRLEVPAGALSAATAVRIVSTFDNTPLPTLAERVGQQFAIEPSGTALATAARLTLPFDAQLVRQNGATASGVKVWMRDGDGWALREAASATGASVTIEVAAFATAAAGVRLEVAPGLCDRRPLLCVPTPQLCSSFCIDSLGTPAARALPFTELTADGNAIYYASAGAATNTSTVARVQLSNRALTTTGAIVGEVSGPVVPARDGSIWSNAAESHVNFRFGAVPESFARLGRGSAAITGVGTVVLLNAPSARLTARAQPPGAPLGDPLLFVEVPPLLITDTTSEFVRIGVAPDVGDVDTFWALASTRRIVSANGRPQPEYGVRAQLFHVGPAVGGFRSAGSFTLGNDLIDANDLAVAPDGSVAVFEVGSSSLAMRSARGGELPPIELPRVTTSEPQLTARDVAFDRNNNLWIASATTPELVFVPQSARIAGTTDGVTVLSLAPSGANATQRANALPRALTAVPDGRIAVQTRGGEIFLASAQRGRVPGQF